MKETMHILLYRAFHAQRNILRPCMRELGLGAGQPKIIVYLDEHGPCRQRELADYFEVDPAAVSRMLTALERGGFILRDAGSPRKRCGIVELTEKGRQAALDWLDGGAEFDEKLLRGFSDEEREQFASFIRRAYRNLRSGEEITDG